MSAPVSAELQSKIASWRLKAAEGTLTLEEMKEGVAFLRAGRMSAALAAVKSKTKKTAVAPSADDMLADLGDL